MIIFLLIITYDYYLNYILCAMWHPSRICVSYEMLTYLLLYLIISIIKRKHLSLLNIL